METRRGQAVMEYLITYGLALFVILIVLAILVAVVLPNLRAPETCQFTQPGFSCNQKQHAIIADTNNDVRLVFQLDNTQGKSVIVKGVICSTEAPGNIKKDDIETMLTTQQLAAGESTIFGATVGNELECVGSDGTTTVQLAPNSNFQGSIGILYTFPDDISGIDRLAVASVAGVVQAE
jgi:hypothetical protein